MKVSKSWLKELVDLKAPIEEVERLLPLRTIGTKEITDSFIELDMKGYNRADLLSMRGVAYEIAAIADSEVKFSEENEHIWDGQNLPNLSVEVQAEELCPVYCLAKIEGLKVESSPAEVVAKLEASGMRPVNNIVDVTNLVMLEYGQPLHAFDGSTIKDGKIIVRTAKDGEELVTLDDKKRVLTNTDLVIADPEKAVGLAGVMGGKNSEITGDGDVYLEAAIFNPIALRKTASRLGLHSEASKRFQHGLTKKRLLQALDRAIRMLGGKLTALSVVESGSRNQSGMTDKEKVLQLRLEKVNSLIGIELTASQVEDYLTKLYFKLDKNDSGWEVTVPYFRLDIELEEDLIEEVARMYGYEKIPAQNLSGQDPDPIDQHLFEFLSSLKQQLSKLGLTEVETYSFCSDSTVKNIGYKPTDLLRLSNPMSAETEYLRMHIWPNLLEVVTKNIRQGYEDIAVFEVGKVYSPGSGELPKEDYTVSIALMNGTDNPVAELYQIVESIIKDWQLEEAKSPIPEVVKPLFHPTRGKFYLKDGQPTGGVTEIHPRLLFKYGIDKRVAVAEFRLTEIL